MKMETYLGSLLWVAVATLLPLTALEPVGAQPSPARLVAASAEACADGSVHLAMGCVAVQL